MKIHMHDRAAAEKWLSDAQAVNDDAKVAVKAAAQAVKDIGGMADGTLIDELVIGGQRLMELAEKLSNTMTDFTDLVKSVLDVGEEFVNNGKKYVKEAFENIL